MKKILILAAFALLSCKPAPQAQAPDAPADHVDPFPNLPRTTQMKTGEDITPPKQAREFCARNKDFAQC